ncbi:tannase/feruloyl esterase family alpha/beta hydrolase [Paenibacillus sp. MMS20-IR301]|uniref:tannase/feruloyl esterase family alpha/beta hydrolase n=1 Tax=Paenibacillus sp. MMS20-IR301 TaxID=2895946 RepID=UPI0037C8EA8D
MNASLHPKFNTNFESFPILNVPPDGVLDYYNRVVQLIGSNEDTRKFFRLFFNPGDGHGNCYTHGPGLTKTTGMKALMDWVEKGDSGKRVDRIFMR